MAYIKVNDKDITSMYYGNTPVVKAYRGDVVVYEKEEEGWYYFEGIEQWSASTKTIDGYNVIESYSNYNVDGGVAWVKVVWKGIPNFWLYINSYAESGDYTIAYKMDLDPNGDTGSSYMTNTQNYQLDPTTINAFEYVRGYSNDGGEHFAWICYKKDLYNSYNDDRGRVAVPNNNHKKSNYKKISNTEFVYKNGTCYEVIITKTYNENGFLVFDGNVVGNELTGGTLSDLGLDGYIYDEDDDEYYNAEKYCYTKDNGDKLYCRVKTGSTLSSTMYIRAALPIKKGTVLFSLKDENGVDVSPVALKDYASGETVYVFDDTLKCTYLSFKGFDYYSYIEFKKTSGSYVTDLSDTFSGCTNLTTLNLTNFHTSRATDMSYMFKGCDNLKQVTFGRGFCDGDCNTKLGLACNKNNNYYFNYPTFVNMYDRKDEELETVTIYIHLNNKNSMSGYYESYLKKRGYYVSYVNDLF